ncbi:MAG: hypothetical protein ACR2MQ_03145 [Gemmatimonadaceae bacterium]
MKKRAEQEGHMDRPEVRSDAGVDARQSPFYEWLDNAAIRDLVLRSLGFAPGELLVLIKGLVPGLVAAVGLAEVDAFLAEIAIKAHRFQEAVDHPGEGRAFRVTPGEELGGPTPAGHEHLAVARDPDRRGAREAERAVEGELWVRTEHTPGSIPGQERGGRDYTRTGASAERSADGHATPDRRRDDVEMASLDSFPSSDPPGWTPLHIGGATA